jgi:hypothetical protein
MAQILPVTSVTNAGKIAEKISVGISKLSGLSAKDSAIALKAGIIVVIVAAVVGALRSGTSIMKGSHSIATRVPLAVDADEVARRAYTGDSVVKYTDVIVSVIATILFIAFATYSLMQAAK